MAERRVWRFAGMVQGVGFRHAAYRAAERHDVTGWVRNVNDGSVEMVAEGTPAALDAALADLDDRMGAYFSEVRCVTEPATGEFNGFTIRR